ncbi:MAG: dihydroneopterin aldolase [Gammaproteobacteria bacterium]|nr:dihydroneopterin aldolase [Gammaproteobacteria bacterium]MDH3465269.1 dihydroneopterin aldolase [Gammaproteobacteria bacterium]
MDIIYLHGLKVDCVIGVWEWERRITQVITIDLDMGANIAQAARSDDLNDTLSYKAVSKRVTAFVQESRFKLVETMAERVAAILLDEFDIPWCRVRINKKGAVRGARDVGVVVERGVAE